MVLHLREQKINHSGHGGRGGKRGSTTEDTEYTEELLVLGENHGDAVGVDCLPVSVPGQCAGQR